MKTRHIILAQFVFIINLLNLVCHLLDSEPCQIRTFDDDDHFDDDDDNIDGEDDHHKDNLNKDSHNKQNHKEDNQDKYNSEPPWLFLDFSYNAIICTLRKVYWCPVCGMFSICSMFVFFSSSCSAD